MHKAMTHHNSFYNKKKNYNNYISAIPPRPGPVGVTAPSLLSDRLRKRRCFADQELDRTIVAPSPAAPFVFPASLGTFHSDSLKLAFQRYRNLTPSHSNFSAANFWSSALCSPGNQAPSLTTAVGTCHLATRLGGPLDKPTPVFPLINSPLSVFSKKALLDTNRFSSSANTSNESHDNQTNCSSYVTYISSTSSSKPAPLKFSISRILGNDK